MRTDGLCQSIVGLAGVLNELDGGLSGGENKRPELGSSGLGEERVFEQSAMLGSGRKDGETSDGGVRCHLISGISVT